MTWMVKRGIFGGKAETRIWWNREDYYANRRPDEIHDGELTDEALAELKAQHG